MKLISWNVNGLRAVMGKGFMDFFKPGLGMTVLITVVSMIFIPIFWPL